MFKRLVHLSIGLCFILNSLGGMPQAAAYDLALPAPGTMVNLSPAFKPVIMKGLVVHKNNPFLFDFIIDTGQENVSGQPLEEEGEKLIKYFLASLAIPEADVWVNLSPYEKNRMIPQALSETEMGKDLLEQDYILKQLTASLIYPEKQLGKIFWDKVYAKAQAAYGTTQIPVNTFNKVWIMADRAEVYEHGQTAFVVDSHLKVMLEEDYLALKKHGRLPSGNSHSIASRIVRQIVLPELENEVNTGRNFANLRQIFNSIILSSWYKKSLKKALLNQIYADKDNVKGIDLNDPAVKERIYQQYLKAYKKGVFNYIKEDINAAGQAVPRKYFSGGVEKGMASEEKLLVTDNIERLNFAMQSAGRLEDFKTGVSINSPADRAMSNELAMELEQASLKIGKGKGGSAVWEKWLRGLSREQKRMLEAAGTQFGFELVGQSDPSILRLVNRADDKKLFQSNLTALIANLESQPGTTNGKKVDFSQSSSKAFKFKDPVDVKIMETMNEIYSPQDSLNDLFRKFSARMMHVSKGDYNLRLLPSQVLEILLKKGNTKAVLFIPNQKRFIDVTSDLKDQLYGGVIQLTFEDKTYYLLAGTKYPTMALPVFDEALDAENTAMHLAAYYGLGIDLTNAIAMDNWNIKIRANLKDRTDVYSLVNSIQKIQPYYVQTDVKTTRVPLTKTELLARVWRSKNPALLKIRIDDQFDYGLITGLPYPVVFKFDASMISNPDQLLSDLEKAATDSDKIKVLEKGIHEGIFGLMDLRQDRSFQRNPFLPASNPFLKHSGIDYGFEINFGGGFKNLGELLELNHALILTAKLTAQGYVIQNASLAAQFQHGALHTFTINGKTFGVLYEGAEEPKEEEILNVPDMAMAGQNGNGQLNGNGHIVAENGFNITPEFVKAFDENIENFTVTGRPQAGKDELMNAFIPVMNEMLPEGRKIVVVGTGDIFRGVERLVRQEGVLADDEANYRKYVDLMSPSEQEKMINDKNAGRMIDIEIVSRIINKIFQEPHIINAKHIFFNGYPRDLQQWQAVKEGKILLRGKPLKFDLILDVHLPREVTFQRAEKRRNDYIARGLKPRKDDMPETVFERQNIYDNDTARMMREMEKEPNFRHISSNFPNDTVQDSIRKMRMAFINALNRFLGVYKPVMRTQSIIPSVRRRALANAAMKTPGGIDLNTSAMGWNVRKDGQGVQMDLDPAAIARIKAEGIDSLVPVIFQITPIANIWPLVGLSKN